MVKGISFNSVIVAPIRSNGSVYGVISARMSKEHSKFNDRDIRFVSLVAQITSLLLTTGLTLPHEFLIKKTAA
jgi:putative methionine-R-sulfoxide reductase with GAF domain